MRTRREAQAEASGVIKQEKMQSCRKRRCLGLEEAEVKNVELSFDSDQVGWNQEDLTAYVRCVGDEVASPVMLT